MYIDSIIKARQVVDIVESSVARMMMVLILQIFASLPRWRILKMNRLPIAGLFALTLICTLSAKEVVYISEKKAVCYVLIGGERFSGHWECNLDNEQCACVADFHNGSQNQS